MRIFLFFTFSVLIVACQNFNNSDKASIVGRGQLYYVENTTSNTNEKLQFEIVLNEQGYITKKIDYVLAEKPPIIEIFKYDEHNILKIIDSFVDDWKISTERFDKYGNQIEFVVNEGRGLKRIVNTIYSYDSKGNKLNQLLVTNVYSNDKIVRADSSYYSFKYSNGDKTIHTYLIDGQLNSTRTTKSDSSQKTKEIVISTHDGTFSREIYKYDNLNRIIFFGESATPKLNYNNSTLFSEYREYNYDKRNLLLEIRSYKSNKLYSRTKYTYNNLHLLKTEKIPIESMKYFL
jgi:hypothetical protein